MKKKQRLHRKGSVVRAEINTALFAQFSAQNDAVPRIFRSLKRTRNGSKDSMQNPPLSWRNFRVQIKKLEKQLSVREDTKKRLLLDDLTQHLHLVTGSLKHCSRQAENP